MKAKYFLLTSFLFSVIAFCMYIVLFYFQLGAPVTAEWWIKNSYQYKDFKAKSIKSKKIIIISGSNSLFGINSELIEQKTGYPVVNLAVHASLDIDFLYYKIKEHINEGDIIVLPLETGYYRRTNIITDWFSMNMMGWGSDYLKQLSFIDLVNFIITTEPKKVLEGIVKQIESNGVNSKVFTQQEVLKQLDDIWLTQSNVWKGYSHESLNKFGDINVNLPVTYTGNVDYLAKDINISLHFLNTYRKIEKIVSQYNGKLYLTYPVTIRNSKFDLSKNNTQERVNNFESLLKQHNIEIQCNMALFNLDRDFFLNTEYHPNKFGALIRSENLADCLNKLQKNDYRKLSYNEAISQTNLLQEKYSSIVKRPAISHFQKRFDDLTIIKIALEKYHADNGKYPISKGFDGLYTKWGKQGLRWISGLTPKYIKSLPRDPRKLDDPNKQYYYKSNGKDYKLIGHGVEDCHRVQSKHPELIDHKRNCWAYGFWTEGAKLW